MCGFTRARFTECKHNVVLTAPQHTLLCNTARSRNLVQGFDPAPSTCHPMPFGEEPNTLPELDQIVVGHCDACRLAALKDLEEDKRKVAFVRGRAKDQEHVSEIWIYDEDDWDTVNELRIKLQETIEDATIIAKQVEALLMSKPEILDNIFDIELRTLLAGPGERKYSVLWQDALNNCGTLLQCLELQMNARVPERVYEDSLLFIRKKMQDAGKNCSMLKNLIIILDGEGVDSDRSVEAIEHLCEKITAWVRMDRQGVVETSGEHPKYEDMDEIEFEGGASPTTSSTLDVHGTCGSVHNVHPFRRNDFTTPLAMSAAPHGAKLAAAIIAARRLKYDLKLGIGNDEPAKNIVIEHYPFPEPSPNNVGMTFAVPDSASNSDGTEVGMTFAVPDSSSSSSTSSPADSNFTLTLHAPDSDEEGENTTQFRSPRVSLWRKVRQFADRAVTKAEDEMKGRGQDTTTEDEEGEGPMARRTRGGRLEPAQPSPARSTRRTRTRAQPPDSDSDIPTPAQITPSSSQPHSPLASRPRTRAFLPWAKPPTPPNSTPSSTPIPKPAKRKSDSISDEESGTIDPPPVARKTAKKQRSNRAGTGLTKRAQELGLGVKEAEMEKGREMKKAKKT